MNNVSISHVERFLENQRHQANNQLTTREQFALAAMRELMRKWVINPEVIATESVKMADAMIKELDK